MNDQTIQINMKTLIYSYDLEINILFSSLNFLKDNKNALPPPTLHIVIFWFIIWRSKMTKCSTK